MAKTAAIKKTIHVRPDSKGRITLGKFTKGVSSFRVSEQSNGAFLLEPMVEIPASEQWLFRNKTALANVKKGLLESAHGKVKSLGSFAKYADIDSDNDE